MAVRESQDRQLGGRSKKFVTVEEAARRLDVPADDVEAMIRSGALQAFRIGGHLMRLRLEDVETIRLQEAGNGAAPSEPDHLAEFLYFNGFYIVAVLVVLTLVAVILAL